MWQTVPHVRTADEETTIPMVPGGAWDKVDLLLNSCLIDVIEDERVLQNCSVGIVGEKTPFTIYDDEPVDRYVSFIALNLNSVLNVLLSSFILITSAV